jgi:hypothetical protein
MTITPFLGTWATHANTLHVTLVPLKFVCLATTMRQS